MNKLLHLPLIKTAHQEAAKWIDLVSVKQQLNEVVFPTQVFPVNIAKFLRTPILKKQLPTAASVECKNFYRATESQIEMKHK